MTQIGLYEIGIPMLCLIERHPASTIVVQLSFGARLCQYVREPDVTHTFIYRLHVMYCMYTCEWDPIRREIGRRGGLELYYYLYTADCTPPVHRLA